MKRNVKHLLLRKIDVLKFRFSRKENLKKCINFEKVQGIFGGTFILALSSPAVFRLQKRVSNFF